MESLRCFSSTFIDYNWIWIRRVCMKMFHVCLERFNWLWHIKWHGISKTKPQYIIFDSGLSLVVFNQHCYRFLLYRIKEHCYSYHCMHFCSSCLSLPWRLISIECWVDINFYVAFAVPISTLNVFDRVSGMIWPYTIMSVHITQTGWHQGKNNVILFILLLKLQ